MFYKNTGTATNATYVEMTGANSLFHAVDVGAAASPVFVDIDRDGDKVPLPITALLPSLTLHRFTQSAVCCLK